METNRDDNSSIRSIRSSCRRLVERFHRDESGVAMTEYIIVFSLISFGATLALLATAAYVKAYRDFLVWWLAHPAV
jgi:Flp pilus assembly pilin Flp